jgi:hypothetical protein
VLTQSPDGRWHRAAMLPAESKRPESVDLWRAIYADGAHGVTRPTSAGNAQTRSTSPSPDGRLDSPCAEGENQSSISFN